VEHEIAVLFLDLLEVLLDVLEDAGGKVANAQFVTHGVPWLLRGLAMRCRTY
jgi:hypothetical protein